METVAGLEERCKTSRLLESSALSCVVRSLFCGCKSWWNTLFRVSNITSIISNWGFAFETATVDFRGKRWFPLSNATKITFYSLMKGAFSASRQTGSVSRHYPSTLITFYPLPGRNWTCGTYAPGVTTAMLMYPKNRPPKGTARVKGREVETVSHITCFINFKPRFDIIVQVVSISQIVAAKTHTLHQLRCRIWLEHKSVEFSNEFAVALGYFIHLRNWSSFLSGETETLYYEKRLCLPRQVKSRRNEHQKYAALISHRGLRMSLVWISKPVVFHGMSPSVIYCCILALPRRCRSFNQSLRRLSTFYPFYVDVSRPRCMFT